MLTRQIPRDDADPLDWLLFEQSGVLTYRQAVDLLGAGRVRHLTASRRWRAVGRGLLLAGTGRLDRHQQLWVAVLAAGAGAVLAGPTAVHEAGVRGVRPDPIHVLVPAARAVSTVLRRLPIDMPGVRVHRTAVLPKDHLRLGRPPRTALARAVIDAATWAAGDDEAITVVAAACQQRRVTPAQLSEVLAVLPRVRRRRLIRCTLDDVAGGAEALQRSTSGGCAAGFGCRRRICSSGVGTRQAGSVIWTPIGGGGGCTSKSTAGITWMCGTGSPTCCARTTSGSPVTASCVSPPTTSVPSQPRWPPNYAAPCTQQGFAKTTAGSEGRRGSAKGGGFSEGRRGFVTVDEPVPRVAA